MATKFYNIITMGCQMNKYDSERIAGILENIGYLPIAEPDGADLIILNTCCVRASADDKAFGRANTLGSLKAKNNNLLIGFGGCLAQKEKDNLFKKAKTIDFAFGPKSIADIPELISVAKGGKASSFDSLDALLPEFSITVRKNRLSAWLPISAGCSNFCTYCIVPYVRGPEQSRPIDEVYEEALNLVDEGYSEITLLGQNVNTYGVDLKEQVSLGELFQRLNEIDGLQRIRFTTSHPRDFSELLMKSIAGNKKVCEYFHLPMQAGSDKVLSLMNRGYTRDKYFSLIEQVREYFPDAAISSDFIVGFPGETDEDFADTVDAVQRIRFDQAFLFLYSSRDGTKAATMTGQVPADVKAERFKVLSELVNDICIQKNRGHIGSIVEVLAEGKSKKDNELWTGRTRTNRIVHFTSMLEQGIGELVDVKIESALSTYLKGTACSRL